MDDLINFIEKIYAIMGEKKNDRQEERDANLLISHTVCAKGNKFKYQCDKCGSLSGQCMSINNNKKSK
jgi:hypothetical protein